MGSCKWHFDTWCISIQEGGGRGVHCSSVTAELPPPPKAPGLQSLWHSTLTQPHLLVPRLDIIALLHPRLVNTKTRFSSMSQIMFVLVLAGIWGRVTDNRHNINTSIQHKLDWPPLYCCGYQCFILLHTHTFRVY